MASDWTVLATSPTIEGVGQASAEMLLEAGCEIRLPETFQAHPTATMQLLMAGVQGIYAGVDDFSSEVLASDEAAKLQIISRWGVGFESIDVAAATELGIVITYTPGLLDEAVADYFTLLLGVARRFTPGISMHPAGGLNNGAMMYTAKPSASSAAAGSAQPLPDRQPDSTCACCLDPFPMKRSGIGRGVRPLGTLLPAITSRCMRP